MTRLLIMADGKVGEELLAWCLAEYRDQLALVVVTAENSLHEMAHQAGVDTHVFTDETTLCVILDELNIRPDVGFLLWWPYLVRAPLLDRPNLTLLNTHPSLLPHNRGKHPNFWAIVEEAPFGVSLHQVSDRVDAGAIFSQTEINYDWTDTGETLYRKGQDATVALVKRALPTILEADDLTLVPQDLGFGSAHLAKELEPASRIDLDRDYRARDLLNLLRARTFTSHPGCFFEDDDQTFEVSIKIGEKKHGR
jgi:methionyl-tRNA formyltransferase